MKNADISWLSFHPANTQRRKFHPFGTNNPTQLHIMVNASYWRKSCQESSRSSEIMGFFLRYRPFVRPADMFVPDHEDMVEMKEMWK